ncbi:MAG: hypothetical protein JW806_07415 [Sedimentisphaerales bacterium]|nr:hypothetical protein [Sedimentisphaerales bacterium]
MRNRCSRCILPADLPGISLDQDGVCNYCRDSKSNDNSDTPSMSKEQMIKRLEDVLDKLRGKGKYDCLVPLSGGKESCYILYTLVKKYNMTPLAFNFNNGFQHKDAVVNIENLVDKAGVDLVIYKPRRDIMMKLFRKFMTVAGEYCTPCNMLINATSFRLAREYKIRAVMSGNYGAIDPGLEGMSPSRYYDRRYYFNVVGDLLSLREAERYVVPSYVRTAIGRLVGTAPQVINVLEFLQPSLAEIHNVLDAIGWKRPGGAIQHGDCIINPVKEYLICRRWGCTETTALYSSLVRNGEMSRQEALEKDAAETEEQSHCPSVLPEFLKNIDLTEEEFNEAVKKDFREIPNMRSSLLFRLAKKTVQKIGQLRGREYS